MAKGGFGCKKLLSTQSSNNKKGGIRQMDKGEIWMDIKSFNLF